MHKQFEFLFESFNYVTVNFCWVFEQFVKFFKNPKLNDPKEAGDEKSFFFRKLRSKSRNLFLSFKFL